MEEKTKFIILDVIGVFFLILGILAIANAVYTRNPAQILYMCYIGLIIIGIGILTKRSFIIMSQIYILAIPLFVWSIDFLYWIIFNQPFLGITDYFFINPGFDLGKIISLQHLFTIPIAIYAASLIGIKRKDAWKLSFIQIILVYLLVRFISPPELNINCVFEPCIDLYPGPSYRLVWFIAIFSMTFITSVLLNYLPFLKIKNEKK